MSRRTVLELVFYGVFLMVLGMLVGLPFREAIVASDPELARAWRVAHTSLVTGGTFYLALAAVGHHIVLSRRADVFVSRAFVFAAWGFSLGFVVGPAIGARGLEPVGSAPHLFIFGVFVAALGLVLVAMVLLLRGAWTALRAAPARG
jgi:hypothetical protein